MSRFWHYVGFVKKLKKRVDSGFFLVCLIPALALGVFLLRKPLGVWSWKYLKLAEFAVFLNRDAGLAVEIGNFYFTPFENGVYGPRRAKKYFKLALERDPKVPYAWHQLSRIYFVEGNTKKALESANKQIEIHGTSLLNSYYMRGLIYGTLKELDKAAEDFKTVLDHGEKHWAVYNDLAWIYFQKGDFVATEKTAGEGLKWTPDNPWLLISRGVALLNLDRKKEAREVLLKAQEQAKLLTEDDWRRAYPGNDPKLAAAGLVEMKKVIEFNLGLIVISG